LFVVGVVGRGWIREKRKSRLMGGRGNNTHPTTNRKKLEVRQGFAVWLEGLCRNSKHATKSLKIPPGKQKGRRGSPGNVARGAKICPYSGFFRLSYNP